jgi:Probable lipoprotein LpqN
MIDNARRWRVLVGGVAIGVAGVLGFAGSTAAADPVLPQPPQPGIGTVPQPVAVPVGVAPVALPAGQSRVATAAPAAAGATGLVPTAAAAVPETLLPATSMTMAEYFDEKDVKLEPQAARDFKALNIVLPVPPGWSQVPDPNVPDAFAVLADRVGGDGIYTSNAQVIVYKLVGEFDPKEAITHGYIDSQQLPAWRTTDASLADFDGMPSARIEGTYRENSQTLNTWRRQVIATAGPDRYLVSLSLTTTVGEAVAAADDTEAIARGFKVSAPNATPAPQPPGAHPLPGLPPPA